MPKPRTETGPARTAEFQVRREAAYLANARSLAHIARSVYSDEPIKDFPVLRNVFDRLITLRGDRVFGLVAANGRDVVVTFRGRDDEQQLVESLAYGQTDWVRGRAHSGIVKLLESIWPKILAAFFDVAAHDKTLWLTGHSLGGSLAMLAAQRLASEGFDPHMVVTFGAPRVLDTVAAAAFPAPLYRFVNNEDAVPNIPWPTLFDTYAHAGEEVFLLPSGDIAAARHSTHLARKLDRAHHIGEGIFPSGPVHDHAMDEYVRKLVQYVETR